MRFPHSPFRRGLVAALVGLAVATPALADEPFPSKPITIVVPYAPGSPPDSYTRLFAEKLRQLVGQTVIVENRAGALTTIGMGYAARAKPDGYTLVYGSNSSLAAAPALFKTLAYDPIKSFTPISVTSESPMILIGKPADAAKGLGGMLEQMRKEPGLHPIGGGAITQELINRLLQNAAKIDQPYARYNNPNLNPDVMAGRLSMAISALAGVAPLVEGGKLHVFATTAPKRLKGKWSHIPTVAETLPGFQLTSWVGFWLPAGTPRPVVKYLHEKTQQVLRDPEFFKRNEESGSETIFMTPEETDAFVKTEGPRWARMLKDAGIEPQ